MAASSLLVYTQQKCVQMFTNDKCKNVHGSTSHNIPKLETTQRVEWILPAINNKKEKLTTPSIAEWINKLCCTHQWMTIPQWERTNYSHRNLDESHMHTTDKRSLTAKRAQGLIVFASCTKTGKPVLIYTVKSQESSWLGRVTGGHQKSRWSDGNVVLFERDAQERVNTLRENSRWTFRICALVCKYVILHYKLTK